MYCLEYTDEDFNVVSPSWDNGKIELSEFDKQLRQRWDSAMKLGHFRYKLDNMESKIIGKKNYIAQLNVKRAQERRQPQEIISLRQPFDPQLFNFTKIKEGEILFEMKAKANATSQGLCNGSMSGEEEVTNLVIINVSPLEYGHVLIVPDIYAMRPQVLTEYCIRLCLESILLSKHPGFRVAFNSLCAYASVNHLHAHGYYLDHELFIESCPVAPLCGVIHELVAMPVKGFVLQLHGSTVEQVTKVAFLLTNYFQQAEIAHCLLLTRGPVFGEVMHSKNRTVKLFLWPRKNVTGVKSEVAFNVAVCELGGHLPIKAEDLYHNLTEEMIEQTLLEDALEESDYQRVREEVIQIYSQSQL